MMLQGKIAISDGKETIFIHIEDIMYVKSDGSYSSIFIENSKPIMISKSLKEVMQKLPTNVFFRIHHSHIINTLFVQKYIEDGEDYVMMNDGAKLVVSRRKKSDFLALFKKL